jgi:hypothetical protein
MHVPQKWAMKPLEYGHPKSAFKRDFPLTHWDFFWGVGLLRFFIGLFAYKSKSSFHLWCMLGGSALNLNVEQPISVQLGSNLF